MSRWLTCLMVIALLAPASAAAAAPPPDLSGRWAILTTQVEISEVPLLGDVTSTATALAIAEVRQVGTEVGVVEQLCALRFVSTEPAEIITRMPAGFARHVPVRRRRGQLQPTGAGWRLVLPDHVDVLGARLADPARDPLPEDGKDRRLVDVEGDGAPGLTVEIDGMIAGRIRIVQRAWEAVDAAVLTPNSVEGALTWRREDVYLAATNPFLRSPLPTRQHPDAARHRFKMRRVAPTLTCAEVLGEAPK